MRHDRFLNTTFQIAKEVPRASDNKIAALVVCKNNIISVGMNQMKTHPMVASCKQNEWSEYLHAESSAIINALRQISSSKLAKCTLYICRAKISGVVGNYVWGMCKPCPTCRKFIENYPVNSCYYTVENGVYEKLE
jgi:cytidine deaminase